MKKEFKKYLFELHLCVQIKGNPCLQDFTFNFEDYCYNKRYFEVVSYFLLNNVDDSLKNCFNVDLNKIVSKFVSVVFVRDVDTNLLVDLVR